MKRTTRNAAKTRQEIIERAAPVFNVHGYAGTKMQMLVDATGYQMGGIYRHFDTKMDLAKAAFQHNYDVLIKANLVLDDDLNPQEKLLRIIENYKKMIIKPAVVGGCPILNTATEVDDTNKEFSLLAKSFAEEVLATLEEIMTKGKEQGLFQSSIEPRKEALFLFASFEGAILIGKLTKSIKALFEVFERILSYLENSVFEK